MPAIAASRPPKLGTSIVITLVGALPNTVARLTVGLTRANIDLGFIGMPTCLMLRLNDLAGFNVNTGPLARTGVPIPSRNLIGLDHFWQWTVFDAAANPLALVASDGLKTSTGQ